MSGAARQRSPAERTPDRTPIVVGIVAITGIVAWFALRDGGEPSQTPSPRQGSARPLPPPPTPPTAALQAPAGPSLPLPGPTPDLPPGPPGQAAGDAGAPATPPAQRAFDAEPRDDAWADRTERAIRTRFVRLRGAKLASTECRTAQCQLVIAGAQDDVGDTIAELEGPRGMHGFAKHVLLTAPAKRPDGSVELRAYLAFER